MISYFLGIFSPVRNTSLLPYSVLTSSLQKCGFLHVCVQVLQSCLTLCDPMDCNLPGSCVHGIILAIILESIAISSSDNPVSSACPALAGDSLPLSHLGSL